MRDKQQLMAGIPHFLAGRAPSRRGQRAAVGHEATGVALFVGPMVAPRALRSVKSVTNQENVTALPFGSR